MVSCSELDIGLEQGWLVNFGSSGNAGELQRVPKRWNGFWFRRFCCLENDMKLELSWIKITPASRVFKPPDQNCSA
jgi:hypothetical protein